MECSDFAANSEANARHQGCVVAVTPVAVAREAVHEVDAGLRRLLLGDAFLHDDHEGGFLAVAGFDGLDAGDGACHVAHLVEGLSARRNIALEVLVVPALCVLALLRGDQFDRAELTATE